MKKLQGRYEDEQIVEIIEIAIEDYDEKWKSAKFQRPTIGAIVSFIADQVVATIEERKEQDVQFAEYESKADEMDEKLNDKLSKLDRL
jgi:uncharacterized protein (UPF0305 family)